MLRNSAILMILLIVCLLGCAPSGPSAEVLALRKQLSLANEPADALSVSSSRQRLAPEAQSDTDQSQHESETKSADEPSEQPTPTTLVLVAQIGGEVPQAGLEGFPWEAGKAVFYVSDPLEDHGHEGHDHENCPFCARRKNQNWIEKFAMVQMVDAEGQPLSVDARELLDVEEGQTVVVRGEAEILDYGLLVVKADGIYIRR